VKKTLVATPTELLGGLQAQSDLSELLEELSYKGLS
jgi:hypothetical protein